MWLEGYHWPYGKQYPSLFRDMVTAPDLLKAKACKVFVHIMGRILYESPCPRLKTFRALKSPGFRKDRSSELAKFSTSYKRIKEYRADCWGLRVRSDFSKQSFFTHAATLRTLELHDNFVEQHYEPGWRQQLYANDVDQYLVAILNDYSQLRLLSIDMRLEEI